jgi:hypothetical protein
MSEGFGRVITLHSLFCGCSMGGGLGFVNAEIYRFSCYRSCTNHPREDCND